MEWPVSDKSIACGCFQEVGGFSGHTSCSNRAKTCKLGVMKTLETSSWSSLLPDSNEMLDLEVHVLKPSSDSLGQGTAVFNLPFSVQLHHSLFGAWPLHLV